MSLSQVSVYFQKSFVLRDLNRASSPRKAGLLAWAAQTRPECPACFGWATVSQRLDGRRILLSARARVGQAYRRAARRPANPLPLRETVVTSSLPVAWVAGRIRTPSRGRAGDLTPMSLSQVSVYFEELCLRDLNRASSPPKSGPSGLGGPKWPSPGLFRVGRCALSGWTDAGFYCRLELVSARPTGGPLVGQPIPCL